MIWNNYKKIYRDFLPFFSCKRRHVNANANPLHLCIHNPLISQIYVCIMQDQIMV